MFEMTCRLNVKEMKELLDDMLIRLEARKQQHTQERPKGTG